MLGHDGRRRAGRPVTTMPPAALIVAWPARACGINAPSGARCAPRTLEDVQIFVTDASSASVRHRGQSSNGGDGLAECWITGQRSLPGKWHTPGVNQGVVEEKLPLEIYFRLISAMVELHICLVVSHNIVAYCSSIK